jgi:putative phosphoribosyl transferase
MEAAKFLKKRKAQKITVAVPMAPQDSTDRIFPLVEEVICLNIRPFFPFAAADAGEDWHDLADLEVISGGDFFVDKAQSLNY